MKHIAYWDSVAFLGLLNEDKTPVEMSAILNVWASAEAGETHLVTSTLTTAEVIYRKGLARLDPKHREQVSNFFRQPFLSQKPLTREISELARDVVWDCGLKPKDAIHVATAGYYKYRELHTFDSDLVGKSFNVNGFTVVGMTPSIPDQAEIHYENGKTSGNK